MTKIAMRIFAATLKLGTKNMRKCVGNGNDAGNVFYHTGGKKLFPKSTQKSFRKFLGEHVGDLGNAGRLSVGQKVKSLLPGGVKALRQEAIKKGSKAIGSAGVVGAVVEGAIAVKDVLPGAINGEIEVEVAVEHVGRQALKGGAAGAIGTTAVVVVTACTGGVGTAPAMMICATVSAITHNQLTKAESRYMPSPYKPNHRLVRA